MLKKSKIILGLFGSIAVVGTAAVATTLTSCSDETTNQNPTTNNEQGNTVVNPTAQLQSTDIIMPAEFIDSSNSNPGIILAGPTVDNVTQEFGNLENSSFKLVEFDGNPSFSIKLVNTTNKFFKISFPNKLSKVFKADVLTEKKYDPNTTITWTLNESQDWTIQDNVLSNAKELTALTTLNLTATIVQGNITSTIQFPVTISPKAPTPANQA